MCANPKLQTTNPSVCSLGMDPSLELYYLMKCVANGDLAMLTRFLRAGADANAFNSDGRTALHLACRSGNLQAVRGHPNRVWKCLELAVLWRFGFVGECGSVWNWQSSGG